MTTSLPTPTTQDRQAHPEAMCDEDLAAAIRRATLRFDRPWLLKAASLCTQADLDRADGTTDELIEQQQAEEQRVAELVRARTASLDEDFRRRQAAEAEYRASLPAEQMHAIMHRLADEYVAPAETVTVYTAHLDGDTSDAVGLTFDGCLRDHAARQLYWMLQCADDQGQTIEELARDWFGTTANLTVAVHHIEPTEDGLKVLMHSVIRGREADCRKLLGLPPVDEKQAA